MVGKTARDSVVRLRQWQTVSRIRLIVMGGDRSDGSGGSMKMTTDSDGGRHL